MTTANQKKLSETLRTLDEMKKLGALNLEEVPTRTRAAMGAAKHEALQAIPAVEKEYFKLLNESTFKILLRGPQEFQERFATECEAMDILSLNVLSFYKVIGERCVSSIGAQRTFGSTQLALLTNDIREWVFDYKHELPMSPEPHLEDLTTVPTDADALNQVRVLTRAAGGDPLVHLFIRKELIKVASEKRYNKASVPVLIYGTETDAEREALKTVVEGRTFIVDVTEATSTEPGVLKVLGNIREQLQSQK